VDSQKSIFQRVIEWLPGAGMAALAAVLMTLNRPTLPQLEWWHWIIAAFGYIAGYIILLLLCSNIPAKWLSGPERLIEGDWLELYSRDGKQFYSVASIRAKGDGLTLDGWSLRKADMKVDGRWHSIRFSLLNHGKSIVELLYLYSGKIHPGDVNEKTVFGSGYVEFHGNKLDSGFGHFADADPNSKMVKIYLCRIPKECLQEALKTNSLNLEPKTVRKFLTKVQDATSGCLSDLRERIEEQSQGKLR